MEGNPTNAILSRFDELKADRAILDADFQKIVDYVRPEGTDFNGQGGSTPQGAYSSGTGSRSDRSRKIWDTTARESLVTFSGGIQSNMTNPVERWFSIGLDGVDSEQLEHDELSWLDTVTDLVYAQFNRPESGFYTAVGEAYVDLGSYGTDIIQTEWHNGGVKYRTFPLGQCWLDEDSTGMVNTLFREVFLTRRQVIDRFDSIPGAMIPDGIMREKNSVRKFCILHAVQPRADAHGHRAKNKPFASVWISVEHKTTIHESGFNSFPYAVSRWAKRSSEAYGYSPGRISLPDILLANRYKQAILKRALKIVSPPLIVPNDGFTLPINTAPDGVTFGDSFNGSNEIRELYQNVRQDLGITLEMLKDVQHSVQKSFHVDLFELGKSGIEMKATEVIERRNEKLRLLAPMIGRQAKEKLDPLIARTFELVSDHDGLPPAPPRFEGQRLKAFYKSPATTAQFSVRADSMRGYVEDMVAAAQAYPEVMDKVDPDRFASEMARARQVPTAILRSDDEVAQVREARQQQQQQQQMMEAAEPASAAIKNVAQAQALQQ